MTGEGVEFKGGSLPGGFGCLAVVAVLVVTATPLKLNPPFSVILSSGTESVILNRESGDSEPCGPNRAIPWSRGILNIDELRFGLAILSRFSAI